MNRTPLDTYDAFPSDMIKYTRNYGFNFNKKACEYAISMMKRSNPSTGKMEPIDAWTKDEVEDLLKKYDITLENNLLYNFVYVANMAKADFLRSSIEDERHLALYVKDVVDDPDAYDGMIFNRWYADMVKKGIPIEWSDIL